MVASLAVFLQVRLLVIMHPILNRSKNGFTLVELSIVLVILGLLAGGVLSGQSLIRAAELRSISTDSGRYATAVTAFRDKYFALPGDMGEATRFWSFAGTTTSPGCVTNSAAATAAPGTCDGNGNGIIADAASAGGTGESFQAWRQLALAGLVEGSYSGNAGTAGPADYVTDANAPRGRIGRTLWMLTYINNTPTPISSHLFDYNYLNWMGVGAGSGTGSWADDGFLKNEEAWNIDTKLDDGKPATGKVHGMGMDTGCTTSTGNTDHSVDYALSNSAANACALLFNYLSR
jgi:prepilin-type N-terminal cleavage/methylation domain-containing protein